MEDNAVEVIRPFWNQFVKRYGVPKCAQDSHMRTYYIAIADFFFGVQHVECDSPEEALHAAMVIKQRVENELQAFFASARLADYLEIENKKKKISEQGGAA